MAENIDERKYWLALSTHPKIGARTFFKLYKRFRKLSAVWTAPTYKLAEAGLDAGQIEAVREVISKKDPEKEWLKLEKHQIKIIIYPDADYPKLLKEIPDPPGLLYIRGKVIPEDDLALAVVGSRKYTTYGENLVSTLIPPLVQRKITIVSGLALGIDALSHRAALDAGGRTLAVLGCGLDQIYPVSNIRLADRILAGQGAIISEMPLGTPALKHHFPIRNRIIAGLTLGTLVVEAAPNSGSLLTAASAIDYNREVFSAPGSIFSETSQGTNRLIKMGAKIVTAAEDILEDLPIKKSRQTPDKIITPDSEIEAIVLKNLLEPVLVDQIIKKTELSASAINSVLIQLEMKEWILNLGAGRYVINGKIK